MSDADQLSSPSFEPMNAGVSIATGALSFGPVRGRDYAYQTIVVDATKPGVADAPRPGKSYLLPDSVQRAAHLGSPAAKAPSKNTGLGKYAPPPNQAAAAQLSRGRYVIAEKATQKDSTQLLAAAPGGGIPVPDPPEKGAMMRALASYYAAVPSARDKYAVMGAWELT
jgi:hypothetical protein